MGPNHIQTTKPHRKEETYDSMSWSFILEKDYASPRQKDSPQTISKRRIGLEEDPPNLT